MSSVEELKKQLEEERKLRLEAEAKVTMLEGEREEWRSQMGKKLENLKQDLYKSHEEVITCQTTSKEELRDYMVQNLEMVETSLENKLKDTFKELLKEENMLAQSQEAIKQVILDAHEELYSAQKSNQQELQSFIMGTLL